MDSIQRLQQWFLARCDGEWEHSYGIKIETLDNPGWQVEVDLAGTEWAEVKLARRVEERAPADWIHVEVAANKFTGAGGPENLGEIIQAFFKAVESKDR